VLTGIGHQNAAKSICKALTEESTNFVLTCGFAGGLNPELATGTVVFSVDENLTPPINPPPTPPPEGSQSSDAPEPFPSWEGSGVGSEAQKVATQPELLVAALLAAGARPAKFCGADRIAATAAEKHGLWQSTGADAVEMESGVIRAICREHKILSATVRVISDAANEDLPLDFNLLMGAEQNLSYAKLALALAGSPWKICALLKLQKQTQAAAEQLAQVLAKVLVKFPR